MKILTSITALFSTLALTIAPAVAKVDAGTPALLRTVEAHGINVALNPSRCRVLRTSVPITQDIRP